jgi:pyruvate decarboxylase
MDAVYNDIQPWRYGDLCNTYGGEGHTKTYKVETKQQLEHLLSDQEFVRAQFLRFVEVYMQPEDAPKGLISSVNATPERG